MNASIILVVSTLILYATAALLVWRAHTAGRQPRLGTLLLGACAVLSHGLLVLNTLNVAGGLNLGLIPVLGLLLFVASLFVMVASWFAPVTNLMLFVFPISAVAVTLSAWQSDHPVITPLSTALVVHILFAIVAYGILIIATGQSLLLAAQERRLKRHVSSGLMRVLPPLETMERLLFAMLWLGIGILTLAIATGFVFLDDLFAQQVAHHTVMACLSWLVYAILLAGRHLFGWRGTTAVRFALVAFGLLVLAYLGSKFVYEVILAGSR